MFFHLGRRDKSDRNDCLVLLSSAPLMISQLRRIRMASRSGSKVDTYRSLILGRSMIWCGASIEFFQTALARAVAGMFMRYGQRRHEVALLNTCSEVRLSGAPPRAKAQGRAGGTRHATSSHPRAVRHTLVPASARHRSPNPHMVDQPGRAYLSVLWPVHKASLRIPADYREGFSPRPRPTHQLSSSKSVFSASRAYLALLSP